jgi:hypothetical protein
MALLAFRDCQIDHRMDWRPGYAGVKPRLRIDFHPERMVVTYFEDAAEGLTRGQTIFEGNTDTPWREVVGQTAGDLDFAVTLNQEWPEQETIGRANGLNFIPRRTSLSSFSP